MDICDHGSFFPKKMEFDGLTLLRILSGNAR